MQGDPKIKPLLIVDEIDYFLIDRGLQINQAWNVFGLTASEKHWYNKFERQFLQDTKFSLILGSPGELKHGTLGSKYRKPPELNPNLDTCQIDVFLNMYRGKHALFVYTAKEHAFYDKVHQFAEKNQMDLIENQFSLDVLRNLTKKHLVLVTDTLLLRSFDYRCKHGIALLIAGKFESARAMYQCAGRVNRYTDEVAPRYVETSFR